MERLQQFYTERCEPHKEENLVYLKTDFEKIEIDIADKTYGEIRYLELNNLVRFLNPKVDLIKFSVPQISDDLLKFEDFDDVIDKIEEIEVFSEDFVKENLEEMMPLYFLPSHIETKIKNITCGNQRRKIDYRLKKIVPQRFIDILGLEFKTEQKEFIVNYDSRMDYSISFFKFFRNDEHEECIDFDEIEQKVNEVKYKLNVKYIESMDYYFVGNINLELGLIERNEDEHNDDPLYYHFNFWKLRGIDLSGMFGGFCLYPFNKGVL
ncbi:hypothetical protein AAF454_13730 [Kurthia gibsonii]|uniref:DUF38 domain-containing protein n=1 Tax=Kurthia gibsonii TaxID=33946 RepID=A0ABU9LQM3_9BACL|nr:hypothetical protein [Kurthia sp. 11kri321]